MRRVVIESPYAGEVAENVAYAKRAVLDCLRRGEAPYASHLFFTQSDLLDDTQPDERKLGIDAGFAWCAAADAVVVYIDRGFSNGMKQGIARAFAVGRSIEFRSLAGTTVSLDDMAALAVDVFRVACADIAARLIVRASPFRRASMPFCHDCRLYPRIVRFRKIS